MAGAGVGHQGQGEGHVTPQAGGPGGLGAMDTGVLSGGAWRGGTMVRASFKFAYDFSTNLYTRDRPLLTSVLILQQ